MGAPAGSSAPSYWQLLVAQYGKGSQQRGSSRHGPFLLSAPKALQIVGATFKEVARQEVHGVKPVDPRQLALLFGLALDCGRRKEELGLGEETIELLERLTLRRPRASVLCPRRQQVVV